MTVNTFCVLATRSEAIEVGPARLVGTDVAAIVNHVDMLLIDT